RDERTGSALCENVEHRAEDLSGRLAVLDVPALGLLETTLVYAQLPRLHEVTSSGEVRMSRTLCRTAVLLTVLGFLISAAVPRPATAQQKPLRIGLLIPTSGVFAAPGKYMQEGLEL